MSEQKLDPRVSEFETEEQAASYDRWFRARVETALKNDRPRISHDAEMARIYATIERVAAKRKQSA